MASFKDQRRDMVENQLKARGIRAGVLSNGDPEMLTVGVKSAGFADLLARFTTLPTKSESILAANSLRFRSKSSKRGPSLEAI